MVAASDKCGKLITSTAIHFFGVAEEKLEADESPPLLVERFINDSTCRTLYAQPLDLGNDRHELAFTDQLPADRKTLVFFKLAGEPVTEGNFHDLVEIASTAVGDGSALVESLRRVWAPTLQASGVNSSFLRRFEAELLALHSRSSVAEEINYWKDKHKHAKRSHDKTRCAEVLKLLQNIEDELENGLSATKDGSWMGITEDIVEAISGLVDDLWKIEGATYPEDRMKTLLDVIGNKIVAIARNLVEIADNNPDAITGAANLCEKWVNATERSTGLFWPHQSLHPWRGGVFLPERCAKLAKRLGQIAELRAQHHQLTRLLTLNERSALGTDALLNKLDSNNDVILNVDDDSAWDRFKRQIEESFLPAEERVAQKLKRQFADAATSPSSLVAEFRRYADLMKREGLKRALRGERELLLSSYRDLIEACLGDSDTEKLVDEPKIFREVQSARASEIRLASFGKLGKEVLADLPGYDEVAARLSNALKEAEKKRRDLLESWLSETREAVSRKELALNTDSTVVELTGASLMRVNYDPRLINLIREARALSGEGVELPRDVRDLVETAGALAGRATALRQIANFHNTVGDRMVPSQQPLMLSTALELARAVQEQAGVVWSDPRAVDLYTARLQELVKKFARQNAELAGKHAALRDLVSGLFRGEAVNFIGNQAVWKDTLAKMRSIVDTVESEYGNTRAWKLHWDRQLFKALDIAYRGTLPSLLRKLPEIRVELTFRDGSLQWRPPFEEIRAKVYLAIRRSLSVPLNFRGVGDPADARFAEILRKSAFLFGGVYKEAEFMLSAVESVRLKWLNLAAPARINAGERLTGKSAQEWTRAFKDAKAWAQEVGKLRGSDVKVWCVSVDTITVRNDLESASRRCWERLCSDLRAETSSRLVEIIDFLSSASKELERRPRNVQEVGLAYEAHARIESQCSNLANEMDVVAGLAKVLASWTGERLDGANTANVAWQGLTERLGQHKLVLQRQLEDAKVNLRHKAEALRDERERWEAKWSSRGDAVDLDWIETMRERWNDMKSQRNALHTDCRRIGLNTEDVLPLEDEEALKKLETQLDAEEANCKFQEEFLRELKKQEAEEWAIVRRRLPRLHDWLDSWEERTRAWTKNEQQERVDDSLSSETFVERRVREIKSALEAIQVLRGDELAEDHWAEIRNILGLVHGVSSSRDITLGHLLGCADKIRENSERIKEITKGAAAESGIRQALAELETWESSTSLRLQEWKDSKSAGIFIVEEYGSSLSRAGELRLLLEGAKGTSGYERFASRVARCESSLSELEERINALSTLQRKWIYLEPIYAGGAAPNDSGRWIKADKEFRYLMGEVFRDPRLPSLRRLPLPALTNLKDLFDRCQRSLDEFLEEKRSSYPRLYFLSDEDLLELVSGNGRGLDAHLPKLYQGVGSVIRDGDFLTALVSPEGETLNLLERVDLREPLPHWLKSLEEAMRNVLRQNLDKCLTNSAPDPSAYPAQILLLSERIRFTDRCTAALKDGRSALKNLVEYLETQRAKYRGLEDAGDQLTALKARGLLLDTVHHLQVARNLLEIVDKGEDTAWTWHRQLRSYKTDNGPVIRCAGAEFSYRFEYQGAAVGLVRTSLTERCFLALTQAMKLGLGGSPTGPAGTGKTESVKALAAVLGRRVLVFNCDEGMDAGSMRRILGGLAQSGAWGCFDEFNRLEEETLSAVAMLVRPLQEAIRDGQAQVQLGDDKIALDRHCCVFITMNPAGEDYGGRHKLPDSLARLFRPIAMAHPDRSDIARALLECAGFLEARALANQLVTTLDISESLLSRQPHYDWGLRALRSILDAVPTQPANLDESKRLLIAIRSSTLPKLTEEDTPKFLALLEDVFPNLDTSSHASEAEEELRKTLLELCKERGLAEEIAERCVELNDQLKSRTGVAVVGPAGCGKSTIIQLLAEALGKVGEHVDQVLLYPGGMPKSRLLGRVDPQTREWKEGLLSSSIANAGENKRWIIFDGDVEPEWAEALNSALDDNRTLTLANGVGMKLAGGIRFIFETHELSSASPATVSRLGVIHLASLHSSSLLTSARLKDLPSNAREIAQNHLSACVDEVLKVAAGRLSSAGLVKSILCQLKNAQTSASVTAALLLSLAGQINDQKMENEIAGLIYQITDCWCPDPQRPTEVLYNQQTDRLEPFDNREKSIDTEDGPILLTGPIQRGLSGIFRWANAGQPVLIRGQSACGKSSLISAALETMSNEGLTPEAAAVIKLSSLYGARELISRVKRACVRLDSSAHGRAYRPKNGSRLILVLENVHLASKKLQELLRELLQEGGFHEDDLEFARIPLTAICTADTATSLHPRLEALLATHYLPFPQDADTIAVLELHLKKSLKHSEVSADAWISRAAPAMLESLRSIESAAEDSTSFWNPKDLVAWANSLAFYPMPESETDLTRHSLDAAKRLFYPKMSLINRNRWMSLISSKMPSFKNPGNDVFISKSGTTGLLPLTTEDWQEEISKITARFAREGEPVRTRNSPEFFDTVAHISWALGGNLRGIALIGRAGAGRKTAVKLAAALAALRIIDSAPGRGKAAIKSAVQSAGIDGEATLLLLEEHHIRENELAVLAAAIAASGELPGLFHVDEEIDGMVAPLADLARREDFPGTLEQYFYHRIRKHLRVGVILDVGDTREPWLVRSELFEKCALIAPGPGCEWWTSGESLRNLASQSDESSEESSGASEGVEAIVASHLQAPAEQQAPARFLALVSTWNQLRRAWKAELESKLLNLEAGISRLREAGDQVAELEDQASKQRQELEAEKARAAAALEQITATMRGATGQRGEMANLKAETERESAELARRKADIEGELSKVEPLVEQAAQAVAGISADALAEVRSLRAPPAPVRDVLEGVLRLMGIKDTSWNSMKTFLAKRGIKDEIRTWDARRSTAASLEAVEKLVKERPESFEEKTAKRASVAAAPLAAWVLANLQYGQILQQVAPLEKEQRLLAQRLSAAEAQLGKLAAGLNTVESRVAQLQEELAERSRAAAALQVRAEATEGSLTTARILLEKLDTEHRDWLSQLEELNRRKARLDLEAADAASILVYRDPRRHDKWVRTAVELLSTERERLLWRAQGLPVDTESLVAACCALRGPLVPILLDPSGVAVTWLKRNIGSQLETCKPHDSRFLPTLELAVRFGKPLLVEELVSFPATLIPLLRGRALRLGDRTLAVREGFRLFLATRREQLDDVPKEARAVLFEVTLGSSDKSLTEIFVEKALTNETPELENQRREILEREERLFGERDAARLELLVQLGTARGQDLLQDETSQGSSRGSLLTSLEATRAKAKEIAAAIDESRATFHDISRRAKTHEEIGAFAAELYKVIKTLTKLSPLYVFSLEAFTDVYLEAVASRRTSALLNEEDRNKQAIKRLIALAFDVCAKAAYRKHRLPLALHLSLALNPLSDVERNLLLNETSASSETVVFNVPDWLPEERRSSVQTLAAFLPEVAAKLKSSWLDDVDAIYAEKSLSAVQKVLLVKSLRPDYLHTALSRFAAERLSIRDLAPSTPSLRKIAQENCTYPVLLLLSPGADPGPELRALAANAATSFTEISLGQGQVTRAELALESTCRNGGWILLSNLQLALGWLARLESILRGGMEREPSARIWLTSEECEGFYPGLAGLCRKLAYEPPEGVKRNVKRSLLQLEQRREHSAAGGTKRKSESSEPRCLVQLCWLHAILQERRRFVPQGWIRAYEWSEADLDAAYRLIGEARKGGGGEWETGRGILDAAVYGGRLQDDYDGRALRAILRRVWCKEVFDGRRKLGGLLNLSEVRGSTDVEGFIKTSLERLTDEDPPADYFGLPANANRAWERSAAEAALRKLKDASRRTDLGAIEKTGEKSLPLSTAERNRLLELIKRTRLAADSNKSSQKHTDPLARFFADEMNVARRLLQRVQSDIETMRLKSSATPKDWLAEWRTGPKEVPSFVKSFVSRYPFIERFAAEIPRRVDISRLIRPVAFLTALRQKAARLSGQPVENLRLCANWSANPNDAGRGDANSCLAIEGLLLSGGVIRMGILEDLEANAPAVATAPHCNISYTPNEEFKHEEEDNVLQVPLYANANRNVFVCALPVGCSREHRDVWLRRSVAFHFP